MNVSKYIFIDGGIKKDGRFLTSCKIVERLNELEEMLKTTKGETQSECDND